MPGEDRPVDLDLDVPGVLTAEVRQLVQTGEVLDLAVKILRQGLNFVLTGRGSIAVGNDQNARGWIARDRLRLGLHSQLFPYLDYSARFPTGLCQIPPHLALRGEGLEALPWLDPTNQ